jgi:exodeoxyribonuclease V beta subunit
MKQQDGLQYLSTLTDGQDEYIERVDENLLSELPVEEEEHSLPGGRHVGRFLHEVIEEIPLDSYGKLAFDSWSKDPKVIEVFEEIMRRHSVDLEWINVSQSLIYSTLTTSFTLPHTSIQIPPLSSVKSLIEMEFIFPIVEETHPTLSQAPTQSSLDELRYRWREDKGGGGHPWSVYRGFVKGFIDYIFEYQEHIYFINWKSDICTHYQYAYLKKHVDNHYLLQAQLYTIGVVRWLRIRSEEEYERRFGGVLYIFLRGFGPHHSDSDGIYYQRPTWHDVLTYETRLGENQFEGFF